MASEIAKKIWQLEWSDGPHQVDVLLQEVREVIDGLLGEVETETGDPESELILRAKKLSERLRV